MKCSCLGPVTTNINKHSLRVSVWPLCFGLVPWPGNWQNDHPFGNYWVQLNTFKKNGSVNRGIDEWKGHTLPNDKYEYCCSSPTVATEWESLMDATDESIPHILQWFYGYKVLKVPGFDVVFEEELRYTVHSSEITEDPWSVKITVFDVRCQELRTFTFKLKAWTGTWTARCSQLSGKKSLYDEPVKWVASMKITYTYTTHRHMTSSCCFLDHVYDMSYVSEILRYLYFLLTEPCQRS